MLNRECKLLIVDDNEDVLDTLRRFFKPRGFRIEEARDGFECITKINGFLPDAVLLDLKMKRIDGDKTITEIKTHCPHAKIIVITGSQDEALRNKIQKMGIDGFYEKPASLLEIHAYLTNLLEVPVSNTYLEPS